MSSNLNHEFFSRSLSLGDKPSSPRIGKIYIYIYARIVFEQGNCQDCGVFMQSFAEKLNGDSSTDDVLQSVVDNARIKIASQLLEMKT